LLPYHRFGIIYTGFDIYNQGNPSYLSQNDLDDYSDMSNQSIDFIYNGESSNERFEWMARYFNGKDKNRWVDPTGSNPDGWDDGIPYEDNTDNQGAQAQISTNLKAWRITGGVDWVDYKIETNSKPEKSSYENIAGFLLAKTAVLNDRLVANGGLRYDQYQVRVQEPPGNTEDDDHVSPSLGLSYLANEWLKLRANYAQAFVMPGADQLAADYFSGVTVVGNPNLRPETSQTIEGGFDIYRGSFHGGLTYFYTDFEDKIELVYLANGSQSWENLGSAVISGLEGELGFDIGAFYNWIFEVRPYAQFTYLTQYEDKQTKQDLLYTPEWTASAGITVVQQESGLSANLNFAYSGKRIEEDWESGLYPAPEVTLGGFTVANLTILKRLVSWERYGDLTLKTEISNLFNKDYQYIKGYPMPGRSFFVGLRYDY
jgi:vitamin B12 transporter